MKRCTTYDEAAKQYVEHTGDYPTVSQLNEMYHTYRAVWRHFKDFTDWMLNEGI